jgi:hypothetical protein
MKYSYAIHATESFVTSQQLLSHSRNANDFMEPEYALPYSQQPASNLYPEPDETSSHLPSFLSMVHFNDCIFLSMVQ